MALYAFDGTNQRDQQDDFRDTNVVRFMNAYTASPSPFYRAGVGTRFERVGRIFGGWMGWGLHARVREACSQLKKNYAAGDKEIDIIGFSRGAATALHFANQVTWKQVGAEGPGVGPPIRFLGLWDVVTSTGPLPGDVDLDLDIRLPANVRRCCHAMALDEGRLWFKVRRVEPKEAASAAAIEEVWFRGVHSDIGGGKDHDGLASITLYWMIEGARRAGVRFDPVRTEYVRQARKRGAQILRAHADKVPVPRKVRPGDCVHCSVVTRESGSGFIYNNPPAGCQVVDDDRTVVGTFPWNGDWPRTGSAARVIV